MIRPYMPYDNLEDVIESWMAETHENIFNLHLGKSAFMCDVNEMWKGERSNVFVLEIEGKVKGIMGIYWHKLPCGTDKIANEHYWYIMPAFRTYARAFINRARRWARENGCSHLMLNASYMASDKCDRVSKLYELMGAKPFERVYLMEVQ